MLDFLMQYGYIGLLAASFLAATILPFSSDIVYVGLIIAGLNPITCTFLATCGNFAGGMTNYWLGSCGKIEWIEKYLKIKEEKIISTQNKLQGKSGALLAFFSWLPAIGDLLAVVLGYMRTNVVKVAVFMFIGKGSRYMVELIIIYLTGAKQFYNYIQ